jgi:hypothetical protein
MKSSDHIQEETLIDFLESGKSEAAVEQHIKHCDVCKTRLEELELIIGLMHESPEVKAPKSIGLELEHAISVEKRSINQSSFNYWQIAASLALLVIGYLIGSQNGEKDTGNITALRNEVAELKEVTMVSALQNYSASQRIQAVNQIHATPITQPSKKLTQALLETLNTDESPNVRYAALQAITRFEPDSELKEKLVSSLKRQEDPLIQITLIGYMVELEEKTAIAPLKDLIKESDASPEVVRQAKIALDILI